jgi:GTPase SAR1 family protein
MKIITGFRSAIIKFRIAIAGKNLAILGAKAVGKTTLQMFIRKGVVINNYDATPILKELPMGTYGGTKFKFFIKSGKDTGGDEAFREVWRTIFLESDICFYLYDAHNVSLGTRAIFRQIEYHLYMLNHWREHHSIQIFVIGTFADLLPSKLSLAEYEDRQYDALQSALYKGKIERRHFMIGSLENEGEAASLVERIVKVYEYDKRIGKTQ